jgi:hypothetical protein
MPELVRRKSTQALSQSRKGQQKVVPMAEIGVWLADRDRNRHY